MCKNPQDFLPKHKSGCIEAIRGLDNVPYTYYKMYDMMANKKKQCVDLNWMFSLRIGRCTLPGGLYSLAPKKPGQCFALGWNIANCPAVQICALQFSLNDMFGWHWGAPTATMSCFIWCRPLPSPLWPVLLASHCFELILRANLSVAKSVDEIHSSFPN